MAAYAAPVLEAGVDLVIVSTGSLADATLWEKVRAAALHSKAWLKMPAGALPGIDALAAGKMGGLSKVTLRSSKNPRAWKGTPAEQVVNLDTLTQAMPIFEGSARDAARLYPKNANVAATLSLAGLGLDATRVRLIADPAVTENIHEYEARGAFGEMRVTMRGKPLAENPKTSALTVLSALRFLDNRASPLTI